MKEAGRNLEFEMVVELGDGEVIFVVGGSLYPPVFVYERKIFYGEVLVGVRTTERVVYRIAY